MKAKNFAHTRPKVLFLTPWYPHRYDPMPGLFIQRHAQAIAEYYQVSVISLHSCSEEKHPKIDYSIKKLSGVEEMRAYFNTERSTLPVLKQFRKLRLYFCAFRNLWKLYHSNHGKPDIVHVHVLTRAGIGALWLRYRFGIPYVITEHWSRYLPRHFNYRGFFRKMLTRWVVRKASAMSTVSHKLAGAMKAHKLEHEHFPVINNVVDTDLFRPVEKIPSAKYEFVHISCFEDRSKNISGLLRIVKKLSERRQDFHISLIGEGIDLEKMRKYASHLDIGSEFITFHGLLEGDALVEKLARGDLLLITSHYENMPVVINEAFSCGLPVISTRVGGIPEHIDDSNGILVEAGNEEAYVDKLIAFMEGRFSFDRQQIRRQAVERYSPEAIRRQFDDLYSHAFLPRHT